MGTIRTAFKLYRTYQSLRPLLRAAGIIEPEVRARSAAVTMLAGAALVGGGMIAGASIALLFAPMSGSELRARIRDRAKSLVEREAEDDSNGRSTWTG